jgi:hypothetical protein
MGSETNIDCSSVLSAFSLPISLDPCPGYIIARLCITFWSHQQSEGSTREKKRSMIIIYQVFVIERPLRARTGSRFPGNQFTKDRNQSDGPTRFYLWGGGGGLGIAEGHLESEKVNAANGRRMTCRMKITGEKPASPLGTRRRER